MWVHLRTNTNSKGKRRVRGGETHCGRGSLVVGRGKRCRNNKGILGDKGLTAEKKGREDRRDCAGSCFLGGKQRTLRDQKGTDVFAQTLIWIKGGKRR